MKDSNRCPRCGGLASHLVTTIDNDSLYKCMTGLTSFGIFDVVNEETGETVKEMGSEGNIRNCDTILQGGKVFTGTVAYVTENKTKTLAVTDGKERR